MEYMETYVKASYCWSQSLLKEPPLPYPEEWGWITSEEQYDILWMTRPEAAKICQELIRCRCNIEKGCRVLCKCVKASLKCTALC